MIVKNIRPRIIRAMAVSFTPGMNVIPENVSGLLMKNKGFNTLTNDGTLIIQKDAAEPSKPAKEATLTAPEMIAVVNGMNSVEDLTKLKDTEKRVTVLKAIGDRINELAADPKDGEGGEGNEGGEGGEGGTGEGGEGEGANGDDGGNGGE